MKNKNIATSYISGESEIEADIAISILEECDGMYTNDGESYLTDEQYDALYQLALRANPSNPYFLKIGSETRLEEKIKLPYPMGSLDQVQLGEIQKWVTDNKLSDEDVVISDKMDGISVCLIYDHVGKFKLAITRGDGYEGHDITRHVKKMPCLPKQVSEKMVVRAEIEFSESNFEKVKNKATRKDGSTYKNARNAIAGMMNNKTLSDVVYEHVDILAYDILGKDLNKKQQILTLQKKGFKIAKCSIHKGKKLTDEFLSEYIKSRKDSLDYAIDGIVIDVDSNEIRNRLTKAKKSSTINPAYAIKYKVLGLDNVKNTTVEKVDWNLSKHGYAKPTIRLTPFELQGVTISNTTGFNAKYILDNNIGKGTVVKMTRSGDVIPYILKVESSTKAEMPAYYDTDYVWSENGVDLILKNMNNEEVKIKQLISWATSLDIPQLKEASVRTLFDNGFQTPESIVNIPTEQITKLLGVNGGKIKSGMQKLLNDIPVEKLFGSHPAFGVGIGVRKFKALFSEIDYKKLLNNEVSKTEISAVNTFNDKTAEKIMQGLPQFQQFLKDIDGKYSVLHEPQKASGIYQDMKICFTGFRDSELSQFVENNGGELTSGVSKKTNVLVAADVFGESTKIQKAKELNIKIISLEDFRIMVDKSEIIQNNTESKFFEF